MISIDHLNLVCLVYPQIDPSEKLDPEVEATLADIAEDFVEAVSSSHPFVFQHAICEYCDQEKFFISLMGLFL